MEDNSFIKKFINLNPNLIKVINEQLPRLNEDNFFEESLKVEKEIYKINKNAEVKIQVRNGTTRLSIEEIELADKKMLELERTIYKGELIILNIKLENKILTVYKFFNDKKISYELKMKNIAIKEDKFFLSYKNITIKVYLNNINKTKATGIKTSLSFLYEKMNKKIKENPEAYKIDKYIKKYNLDFNKILLEDKEYEKRIIEIKELENLTDDENECYNLIQDIKSFFKLEDCDLIMEEKNKLKNIIIGIKKSIKKTKT